MHRVSVAVAASMCALAAASAAAQVVAYSDSKNFYSPEYVGYVSNLGPIPTVIHNDPFGPAADEAVAARLPAPGFASRATFRAAAGPEILAYDRVVLAFNAVPGTSTNDLCRSPVIPGALPTGQLYVQAVLCRGTYPTSEAGIYSGPAGSPDDPAFRRLLAQISSELFPMRAYPHGSGCGNRC
jgi:hypothetical protein